MKDLEEGGVGDDQKCLGWSRNRSAGYSGEGEIPISEIWVVGKQASDSGLDCDSSTGTPSHR